MSKGEIKMQRIEGMLFKDADCDEIKNLTPAEQRKLEQYRVGYTHWYSYPELTEKQLSEFLQSHFSDMSYWNANYLVQAIKKYLGNVRVAGKEWHRYMVVETAKKIYAAAEAKEDIQGMNQALNLIGKYTKLDKNENDEIPYDKIVPPNFEPSADISVLDPSMKIDNIEEKRKRMREKYKMNYDVEDAQEVTNE